MSLVSVPLLASEIDTDALLEALTEGLTEVGEEMKATYEGLVAPWSNPPKFEILVEARGELSVVVGTNDQIFQWVNDGTAPHVITPRPENKTGRLHYQTTFTPMTQRGFLVTNASGGKSGPWAHPARVFHPGVEPRNFDQQVAEEFQPELEKVIRRVLTDPRFF